MWAFEQAFERFFLWARRGGGLILFNCTVQYDDYGSSGFTFFFVSHVVLL